MNKVTILRGLPGSGKSHYTERLRLTEDFARASADDYPGLYSRDGGKVVLNVSLLDEAHGACMRGAIEAVKDADMLTDYGCRAGGVVVDNTNLSVEECIPYVALAQAFRVPCEIVTIVCDPDVAFARQTHGVPREAFDSMVERMEGFVAPHHWQFLSWLSSAVVRDGFHKEVSNG